MKKFIRNTIAFISIFLIFYISIIIYNFFVIKLEPILVSNNKNILILGDSNSQSAINDSIYKSSINFSSSADSYFYSYLKLKKIMESNKNIDTVILSFSPHNIFKNNWTFNREHIYSRFGKYYPLMEREDLFYLVRGNSRAVFSSTPSIIQQFLRNNIDKLMGKKPNEKYGHFKRTDKNILQDVKKKLKNGEKLPFFDIPIDVDISEDEILYLNKIISTCIKNGLIIYLVNFPKREELLNYPKYGVKEFNICYDRRFSSITYLDFSNMIMDDNCHSDFVHLSNSGSDVFSNLLEREGINSLSKIYKRKK